MEDLALTMQQVAVERALQTGDYERYRQELVKLNDSKARLAEKIIEKYLSLMGEYSPLPV